jgi:hypothetical protein
MEGVLDFAVPLAAGPDVKLIEPYVGAGLLQVGREAQSEGGVFAGVAEKGRGLCGRDGDVASKRCNEDSMILE